MKYQKILYRQRKMSKVPEKIKHEGDDAHDKIVYILKTTRDIIKTS